MPKSKQKGQAIMLVLVGLSLFLLGGIGLAVDASHMYAQRQMAQAAADSAAQAAIMSLFDGTNTGANAFGGTAFTCTPGTDLRTPCVYARYNGFNETGDVVAVDFPGSLPGVTLSTDDPFPVVRVTVRRTVDTTLMRFVGPSSGGVTAQGTAAIVDVLSPVPIVVLHPTMSASFQKNGANTIVICGGPSKSIQVNSSNATSIVVNGNGEVDLSKAGPKGWTGPNSCEGSGADFGDFGGPGTYPGVLMLGSDGEYRQPASPIKDPLIKVPPPDALPLALPPVPVPPGTGACPATMPKPCLLYAPGTYNGGIQIKNNFALFLPGVYHMIGGGFKAQANGVVQMATGSTDPAACAALDALTGCGMVVFNTGNGSGDTIEFTANSGQLGGVQYGNKLLGSSDAGPYKGILFFQDRTTAYHKHELQGGGGLELRGTIYLTNTEPTMRAAPGNYQFLELQGTPGSTTRIIGMIIVDRLLLGGTADIVMTLDPAAKLHVRQVALVR